MCIERVSPPTGEDQDVFIGAVGWLVRHRRTKNNRTEVISGQRWLLWIHVIWLSLLWRFHENKQTYFTVILIFFLACRMNVDVNFQTEWARGKRILKSNSWPSFAPYGRRVWQTPARMTLRSKTQFSVNDVCWGFRWIPKMIGVPWWSSETLEFAEESWAWHAPPVGNTNQGIYLISINRLIIGQYNCGCHKQLRASS